MKVRHMMDLIERVLHAPGDAICGLMRISDDGDRDLFRLVVNCLVWAGLGAFGLTFFI
jgi:hypothetical protein